jgi:hypothetical protein
MARAKELVLALAALALAVACALDGTGEAARHRWWSGLGPVLPHDTFPADCSICHVGREWRTLTDDFSFDHEAETGVALNGAHAEATCLRCHNDRGPVEVFQARGCQGCHEDVHQGELGPGCAECHTESTWFPVGQVELHRRTRFPLVGAHATTSCRRCHQGAEVGNFLPADPQCVTCHADDLARTTNHVGLGWVRRCDRCHVPTFWNEAEVD